MTLIKLLSKGKYYLKSSAFCQSILCMFQITTVQTFSCCIVVAKYRGDQSKKNTGMSGIFLRPGKRVKKANSIEHRGKKVKESEKEIIKRQSTAQYRIL